MTVAERHVLEERGSHLIPPPVDNSQSRLLQPNRVGNVGDQKDLENILNVDTLHHVPQKCRSELHAISLVPYQSTTTIVGKKRTNEYITKIACIIC